MCARAAFEAVAGRRLRSASTRTRCSSDGSISTSRAVVGVGHLGPLRVAGRAQADDAVDARPQPPQVGEAGQLDDPAVEAHVVLGDRRDVAGLARLDHLLDGLGQGVELGVVDDPAGLGEGAFLEQRPDRVDRLDLALADADDDRAAVREELDEALLLELAERLADGTAADAELGREGDLEQARAGGISPLRIPERRPSRMSWRRTRRSTGGRVDPTATGGTSWTFGRWLDARDDQTLDCRQSTRAT